MANKRKGLAGAVSGNPLAAAVSESAQQIWLAGLGAFSTAQEQGNKVFEALVKEGAAIQSLVQKAAAAKLREAKAKAAAVRRRLEQVFEDGAARSFKRFGIPTRREVDALSKRVATLNTLITAMTAQAARKPQATKGGATRRRAAPRRAAGKSGA